MHVTDRFTSWSDKMAGRFSGKRVSTCSSSDSSSSTVSKRNKRQVSVATFEKWQRQYDSDYQSVLWLRCTKDDDDKSLVSTLWCDVCRQYKARITGMRNFSASWIAGSTNHRSSSIVDHAKSEQHVASMAHMRTARAKANNEQIESYAPIARYLMTMDEEEKLRMMHKFEICYVLTREGVAFHKYPAFHCLAERQGVRLGSSYKRSDCAKQFTYYIAEAQRSVFLQSLSQVNFFSFLMDGSTDAGNIEQEMIFVLHCKRDDKAKMMRSHTRYFAILNPTCSTADGLIDCLSGALERLDIDVSQKESVLNAECRPVLIGGGTDGASVNVGVHSGMKVKIQGTLPWLYWAWCFSHRLELACKDAFKSPLFAAVSEMLIRLFYLYKKSPKKTQDLAAIGEDLKEVFHFPKGENAPVRCQGTRWISHKRRAMQRVVDRYGAYIQHLTAMISDSSMKAADKAKVRGYLRKWCEGRMLTGCALYVDALKIPSLLSLTLQEDGIDIVQGIQGILKTSASLESLTKDPPNQWPTVKLVLSRITTEGTSKVYQGASLQHYSDETFSCCSRQVLEDLTKLSESIKHRLAWSDTKLLRSILVFLDTRSWTAPRVSIDSAGLGSDDKAEIREAMEYTVTIFREPLEAKGACIFSLQDEIDEIVDFYRKYLESQGEDYRKVWYKLCTAHDARKWPNVILVSELLFSLPFTNSIVERAFSAMKIVKTNRRTSLSSSTLDDLMEINVEGPELESFSPDHAVQLWWSDRTRRPNQAPRKQYRKRASSEVESENSSNQADLEPESMLDAWDQWFAVSEDTDAYTGATIEARTESHSEDSD